MITKTVYDKRSASESAHCNTCLTSSFGIGGRVSTVAVLDIMSTPTFLTQAVAVATRLVIKRRK